MKNKDYKIIDKKYVEGVPVLLVQNLDALISERRKLGNIASNKNDKRLDV